MRKFILSLASFAARLLPNSWKQSIYRVGPLARLIRSGLNRAAPTGLTVVRVAAGGLAGCPLLLDLQTEKDYWLGTYEPDLQAALGDLVPAGAVAYDVGANIGYVTLLLARTVGKSGQVFAFEALPENVERLRRNLDLNGLSGRVTVVPAAVTQTAGPVRFLVHASGGMGKTAGSAGRQEEAYLAEIRVEGLSLDEFVYAGGHPPPQVVKMDIEGGEGMALAGMTRILKDARPIFLIELHGEQAAAQVWEQLTANRYSLHRMRKGYARVAALAELDWKAYVVALPD